MSKTDQIRRQYHPWKLRNLTGTAQKSRLVATLLFQDSPSQIEAFGILLTQTARILAKTGTLGPKSWVQCPLRKAQGSSIHFLVGDVSDTIITLRLVSQKSHKRFFLNHKHQIRKKITKAKSFLWNVVIGQLIKMSERNFRSSGKKWESKTFRASFGTWKPCHRKKSVCKWQWHQTSINKRRRRVDVDNDDDDDDDDDNDDDDDDDDDDDSGGV